MAEKEMEFSESVEDYLETILDLEKTNKVARAKDIAERMGFRQGSVTGALKNMAEKGLINYEPYSFITLTRKGTKIAREITRRHTVLKDFLFRVLQLDVKKADAVACRMEHDIDKASVDKLVQ
ncbi:metal-dependent transcriptional regulator, partial [Desulfobacterales bacterium HSG2]|nr:metal-dependent transcriptional regulator [Desulfobacterales bacterium HSG2]